MSRSLNAGRPTLFATLLFFLLFSGPPSLRLRDPFDSIEGVIDPSVVFQASVWVLAGIWTLYQLRKDRCARLPEVMSLPLPEKLGLLMILFLSASAFVSDAPLLTAFKVGQILVSLLFTWMFVYRYGITRCLDYVLIGSVTLCAAIAISTVLAPDLVFFLDEGQTRLRGDPIAPLPTVVTYSIILLILKKKQIAEILFWPLMAGLGTLLAFSVTRHAWFLVIGFIAFYSVRSAKAAFVRKVGYASLCVFPFLFFFYLLPALQDYRSTESIGTLTGRTDLWVYLVGITLLRSPWIGLGYYSASRTFGIDFNPGMGTAHSTFVEVFLGGGLLSLIPCLALCLLLIRRAISCLSRRATKQEFACGTMFLVTMTIGLLGGDFAYGQVGITFWSLAAALPAMRLGHAVSGAPHGLRLKPSANAGMTPLPGNGRPVET